MTEFQEFPKIARFSREVILTEKIDGTNAQIFIGEDGEFLCGSRTRWLTPESGDNHGFLMWCMCHKDELMKLGPGRHFGEWWGHGIQRGYGLKDGEKRLSLFNVTRWCLYGSQPQQIPSADPRIVEMQDVLPPCVGLVPVLWRGNMDYLDLPYWMEALRIHGSYAAPGFIQPEGVVVFHVAGNVGFKKTFGRDGTKGANP